VKNETEQILIAQLQSGNTLALSQLYDKYSAALYGVILRICKDEAKAKDVLQESFVKIWENASKYDPDKGKFYTWTYRICKNTALNALRKESNLIQTDDLSVYKEKSEEVDNEVDLQKLQGAIKQLETHHQKALELVYFQGLTHREAHEVMEVPLGTFKSYIQQALKRLRDIYHVIGFIMLVWEGWQ